MERATEPPARVDPGARVRVRLGGEGGWSDGVVTASGARQVCVDTDEGAGVYARGEVHGPSVEALTTGWRVELRDRRGSRAAIVVRLDWERALPVLVWCGGRTEWRGRAGVRPLAPPEPRCAAVTCACFRDRRHTPASAVPPALRDAGEQWRLECLLRRVYADSVTDGACVHDAVWPLASLTTSIVFASVTLDRQNEQEDELFAEVQDASDGRPPSLQEARERLWAVHDALHGLLPVTIGALFPDLLGYARLSATSAGRHAENLRLATVLLAAIAVQRCDTCGSCAAIACGCMLLACRALGVEVDDAMWVDTGVPPHATRVVVDVIAQTLIKARQPWWEQCTDRATVERLRAWLRATLSAPHSLHALYSACIPMYAPVAIVGGASPRRGVVVGRRSLLSPCVYLVLPAESFRPVWLPLGALVATPEACRCTVTEVGARALVSL